LKQGLYAPLHVTDQVLSIYAGAQGELDGIPVSEVRQWESQWLRFVHDEKKDLWQKLTDRKALDDELFAAIDAALAEFQSRYAEDKQKTKPTTATV